MEPKPGGNHELFRRIHRFPGTPSAGSFATVCLTIVSAWACFTYWGRSLAGVPGMSPTEMGLRSFLPVPFFSLFLGLLAGNAWLRMVRAAIIPPVLMGLFMAVGFAEHGKLPSGIPLALTVGMIVSIICLGWLGAKACSILAGRSETNRSP